MTHLSSHTIRSTCPGSFRPRVLFVIAVSICVTMAGCQSTLRNIRMPSWKGPLDVSELKREPESPTIDDVQGPLQRMMQARFVNPRKKLDQSPAEAAAEREEFDSAKQLFDAGEYAASEKALKRFSKTHKIKHALRSTKTSYLAKRHCFCWPSRSFIKNVFPKHRIVTSC